MPNISSFGTQTDNAVVQGTVTDRQMIIPEVPPQGLMSVGPRVTPNFVKPREWNAQTTYHFFDAVRDAAGNAYIATKPVVPEGTPLTDEDYWFLWADPDTRFDDLNETVKTFNDRIQANENAIANKAPINHASENTTYGLGDAVKHGHVKLSDNIADFENGADNGIAATPKYIENRIPFVTPEQFGAKGDNINDDTTAFQNAIDTGRIVVISGDKYLINTLTINQTTQLYIENSPTLYIKGDAGITLNADENIIFQDSGYVRKNISGSGVLSIRPASSNTTRKYGIKINGGTHADIHPNIENVFIVGFANSIYIKPSNVYFAHFDNIYMGGSTEAIYIDGPINNSGELIRFDNCHIVNSNVAFKAYSGFTTIFNNCAIDECTGFDAEDINNLWFINCHIENTGFSSATNAPIGYKNFYGFGQYSTTNISTNVYFENCQIVEVNINFDTFLKGKINASFNNCVLNFLGENKIIHPVHGVYFINDDNVQIMKANVMSLFGEYNGRFCKKLSQIDDEYSAYDIVDTKCSHTVETETYYHKNVNALKVTSCGSGEISYATLTSKKLPINGNCFEGGISTLGSKFNGTNNINSQANISIEFYDATDTKLSSFELLSTFATHTIDAAQWYNAQYNQYKCKSIPPNASYYKAVIKCYANYGSENIDPVFFTDFYTRSYN